MKEKFFDTEGLPCNKNCIMHEVRLMNLHQSLHPVSAYHV